MTLANDLKTLRPGDVLVCRNRHRHVFVSHSPYGGGGIQSGGVCEGHPYFDGSWDKDGKATFSDCSPSLDIVRIIKAKPEKRRKDAISVWLNTWLDHIEDGKRDVTITGGDIRRLRKIARRLESTPGTKP